jgi:hypothetical protein
MLKQDEIMVFPSLGDSYEVATFPRVTEGEGQQNSVSAIFWQILLSGKK